MDIRTWNVLSKHINTRFGIFFWYILVAARIIILEKCRTFASRAITFSIKSEEGTDETCLMHFLWELDIELGAHSSNILRKKRLQKQKTTTHTPNQCYHNYNNCNTTRQYMRSRTYLHRNSPVLITERRLNMPRKKPIYIWQLYFSTRIAQFV